MFALKMTIAVLLFLLAMLAGVLPLLAKRLPHHHRFFALSELFARGVFLGVGLCHLLPDALEHYRDYQAHAQNALVYGLVVVSLVGFIGLERLSLKAFQRHVQHDHCWTAYLLALLLSVHSLFEGTSIGVAEEQHALLLLFIAIVAHKGIAAFALAISFHQQHISVKRSLGLLSIFACMTPLGIIFGSSLTHLLAQQQVLLTTAIFNALAAGTFIYIALFSQWHETVDHNACHLPRSLSLSGFGIGFATMAILSFYV